MRRFLLCCGAAACCAVPALAYASGGAAHSVPAGTFGLIAIILLLGKLGALIERIGQPAVLGELLIGLILGNLALVGFHGFDGVADHPMLAFLGEIGVAILLFQVGLHCDTNDLRREFVPSLRVAAIGILGPLLLGWLVVGPLFFPEEQGITHVVIGAVLTATSVGITARVLHDFGRMELREATIMLGAAVADDVLVLILAAPLIAYVATGTFSWGTVGWSVGKAILFLGSALLLGPRIAPFLGRLLSRVHTGVGMKLVATLALALGCAELAYLVGLAPIVGAFAAGLILDPVIFEQFDDRPVVRDLRTAAVQAQDPDALRVFATLAEKFSHRHIEDLIEPIGLFVAPFFFILTGMRVDLRVLADPKTIGIVAAITCCAVIGKAVSGFGAGRGTRRALVGIGMVPRGEVGIILANLFHGYGVLSQELFTIVVFVVMASTFVAPPILAWLLRRVPAAPSAPARGSG